MQVSRLDDERQRLVQRAHASQAGCAAMAAQLQQARARWQAACAANSELERELAGLRGHLRSMHVRSAPPSSSSLVLLGEVHLWVLG
jgi:hypothetical protein